MNIYDSSPFRDEEGKISLLQHLYGVLEYGFAWRTRIQAADAAVKRLQRTLGNEFRLFRDFSIPGIDARHCIMILLGPQGILALMASPLKGIYRAKGTEWMSFDHRARKFKKSRPNYQEIILNVSSTLKKALESQGLSLIEVESVLIFTNPRTLIDTARPRVRIVPADAVDYFAANLQQLPEMLDKEDISYLTDILTRITAPEPAEKTDQITPQTESEEPVPQHEELFQGDSSDYFDFPDSVDTSESVTARPRLGLQRRQWLIIGFLFLFEILILALFALLILSNSDLLF